MTAKQNFMTDLNQIDTSRTIGLFGTCGQSQWRQAFIAAFQKEDIPYFNPQVNEWTPDCVPIENHHFARDPIILFPVTDETPAAGSLGEIGFSVARCLSESNCHFLLVFIDPECNDPNATEAERKNSVRARKLVSAKLEEQQSERVIICTSLDEMLERSLGLHGVRTRLSELLLREA
jgi:hypothetical protein